MRPSFNKGVAAKYLFNFGGRRSIQVQALYIMTGISFVNGYIIGCIVIKHSKPVVLLLCCPFGINRCYIVVRFCRFLKRARHIHKCGTGRPRILWRFLYLYSYFRRYSYNVFINQELSYLLKMFFGNWYQAVCRWML